MKEVCHEQQVATALAGGGIDDVSPNCGDHLQPGPDPHRYPVSGERRAGIPDPVGLFSGVCGGRGLLGAALRSDRAASRHAGGSAHLWRRHLAGAAGQPV
ncbi:hypothetical protein AERO8C_70191 [Aeromonas veronii]|uniref:Uncharacterized protein n=1 Tax=Aeromonas veronii TaxID=654 RepID=A0A653LCK6_AERVE|nr:hypothetical protein AERO8C_70191 [Aeromonas veronii]